MFAFTLPPRPATASCQATCPHNSASQLPEVSSFERYAALKALNPNDTPLIISLQLCASLANASPNQQQLWLTSVQQEARLLLQYVPASTKILALRVQGYSQGLPPALLAQLPTLLQHLTHTSPPRTLGIELDSRAADWGLLCQLRDAGYNQLLLNLHPQHGDLNSLPAQRLLEAARTLHFSQLGLSLNSSSPLSACGLQALAELLSLQPDHILLPNRLPAPQLPDLLHSAGYLPLGMHSYVLPDDDALDLAANLECGNSAHPWLLGLGCGAYSQLGTLSYHNHPEQQRCLQAVNKGQLPPAQGRRCNPVQLQKHNMRQQLEWLGRARLSCLAASLQLSSEQLLNQLTPWLNSRAMCLENGYLRLQQASPQQLDGLLGN